MDSIFKGKKIGIWGFGKTGQSILGFLSHHTSDFFIFETNELDNFQKAIIEGHHAQVVAPDLLPQFLELCDIIIASPGVDLRPYLAPELELRHKLITELDLFSLYVKKPVIAITGSVGKTTIVHLLTQFLITLGKKAIAAGNIGMPMLDILATQHQYDYIILELSSFQLEYCTHFRPNIAVITNLYPNHLDRHTDMYAYLEAKGKLLAHQQETDRAILPMILIDELWPFLGKQKVTWVSQDAYADIIPLLSDITCKENLQLIFAIIEELELDTHELFGKTNNISLPEHRMELVGTYHDITFYNDSKATIGASTLQAAFNMQQPTILMLGGLSKGANREELIKLLPKKIKFIVCFGKEAEQLNNWCQQTGLASQATDTLEAGFEIALKNALPGDAILLSPAGSSYDLFKNYEERGKLFKKLVHATE